LAAGDGGGGSWYWEATSTEDDNLGLVLQPRGHTGTGRWVRLWDQSVLHVIWFGPDSEDIGSAIQTVVDLIFSWGGRVNGLIVKLPSGMWGIKTPVVIKRGFWVLDGGPGYGGSSQTPSTIYINDNFTTSVFTTTWINQEAKTAPVANLRIRNVTVSSDKIDQKPATYTVDGYVFNLEAFNQSLFENIRLNRIDGGGVYVNAAIQSTFRNIQIMWCGSPTYPAMYLYKDPANNAWRPQASSFSAINLEHSYHEPQFIIGGDALSFTDVRMEAADHTSQSSQAIVVERGSHIEFVNCQFTAARMKDIPLIQIDAWQTKWTNCNFGSPEGRTAVVLVNGDFTGFSNCRWSSEGASSGDLDEGASILSETDSEGLTVIGCQWWYSGRVVLKGTRAIFADNIYNYSVGDKTNLLHIVGDYVKVTNNIFNTQSSSSGFNEGILVEGNFATVALNTLHGGAGWTIKKGHGIRVIGDHCTIQGNDIRYVDKHGIFIDGANTPSIIGNRINDVGRENTELYDAIHLVSPTPLSGGGTVISGNIIRDLARSAIRISDTDGDIIGEPSYKRVAVVGNAIYGVDRIHNARYGSASGGNNVVKNNPGGGD
jgi:hypothetical protein